MRRLYITDITNNRLLVAKDIIHVIWDSHEKRKNSTCTILFKTGHEFHLKSGKDEIKQQFSVQDSDHELHFFSLDKVEIIDPIEAIEANVDMILSIIGPKQKQKHNLLAVHIQFCSLCRQMARKFCINHEYMPKYATLPEKLMFNLIKADMDGVKLLILRMGSCYDQKF